jgi:hypothetical protein
MCQRFTVICHSCRSASVFDAVCHQFFSRRCSGMRPTMDRCHVDRFDASAHDTHERSPAVRPGEGHDARRIVVSTPDQGHRTIRRSRVCRGQGGIDHTRGASTLPLLAAEVVRARHRAGVVGLMLGQDFVAVSTPPSPDMSSSCTRVRRNPAATAAAWGLGDGVLKHDLPSWFVHRQGNLRARACGAWRCVGIAWDATR